jgi:hypothetical protein
MGTEMGMNRTGIDMSPIDARETVEGATLGPISPGGVPALAPEREEYIDEAGPVGTVPLPATVKGAVQTAAAMVRGKEPSLFIDKLGERLAFERTGTRLYEALLIKLDTLGSWEGGPSREEVKRIHDEELAHFEMLFRVVEALGADPTAVTPGADVAGVAASGILQVVADPRTSLVESLQAMFTAELTDNESWKLLIELAKKFGKEEEVEKFARAQQAEERHVAEVRNWLGAALLGEARGAEEQHPEAA